MIGSREAEAFCSTQRTSIASPSRFWPGSGSLSPPGVGQGECSRLRSTAPPFGGDPVRAGATAPSQRLVGVAPGEDGPHVRVLVLDDRLPEAFHWRVRGGCGGPAGESGQDGHREETARSVWRGASDPAWVVLAGGRTPAREGAFVGTVAFCRPPRETDDRRKRILAPGRLSGCPGGRGKHGARTRKRRHTMRQTTRRLATTAVALSLLLAGSAALAGQGRGGREAARPGHQGHAGATST